LNGFPPFGRADALVLEDPKGQALVDELANAIAVVRELTGDGTVDLVEELIDGGSFSGEFASHVVFAAVAGFFENGASDLPNIEPRGFELENSQGFVVGGSFAPTGNGGAGDFYIADAEADRPWLVAMLVGFSGQDNRTTGADSRSRSVDVTVTSVLLWDEMTAFGLAGTYRDGKVTSNANNSRQDSKSYTLTGSVNRKLVDSLELSVAAAYTRGNNDANVNGATCSFDVDIGSLSTSLSNSFEVQEYIVTPTVSVGVSRVEREAYTDSNGIVIPDSAINSNFASLGANVSRTFNDVETATVITPSAGVSTGYFSSNQPGATLTTGAETTGQLGRGITFDAGVDIERANGWSVRIGGSYGVFQDEVTAFSLNAKVGYRF